MSTEMTRRVVEAFLDDLGGSWLAHDVELVDVGGGRSEHGRVAAVTRLRAMAERDSPATVLAVDDHATVEWGPPDAWVAAMDVHEGEIVRVRVYRPAAP